MDAVEFLKTLQRMCNAKCRKCEFGKVYSVNEGCSTWRIAHPEEAVVIAEKWAKEHPKRTKRSEFLEHYPNAAMRENGTLLCPKAVDDTHTPASGKCRPGGGNCLECMEEYWLAEVEEK